MDAVVGDMGNTSREGRRSADRSVPRCHFDCKNLGGCRQGAWLGRGQPLILGREFRASQFFQFEIRIPKFEIVPTSPSCMARHVSERAQACPLPVSRRTGEREKRRGSRSLSRTATWTCTRWPWRVRPDFRGDKGFPTRGEVLLDRSDSAMLSFGLRQYR